MSHSFRSIPNGKPVKAEGRLFTEADIVTAARQLLEEHAVAREAATLEANRVCGNCKGAGHVESALMPDEGVKCFACEGTGKPNALVQSVPDFTAVDSERIWKLERLFLNHPAYRVALLAVVREYAPDLYKSEPEPS